MDEKKLREFIKQILSKELDEITVTGDIAGYNTPFAFSGNEKKRKKKIKKANKSVGYSMVKEELDNKDLKLVKELIRNTVADIIRDIWLKRASWK